MKKLFFLIVSLVVFSCNAVKKSDQGDGGSAVNGNLAELQATAPIYVQSMLSAYGTITSNGNDGFVAFYTGNRYFAGVVQQLSANSFQMMATVGTYVESNGVIVTTGRSSTCPSWVATSRNMKRIITGTTSSSSISVKTDIATLVLPRLNMAAALPPTGLVVQWGCFDPTSRVFTAGTWSNSY